MNEQVSIVYLSRNPQYIPVLASWVYDYWGEMYRIQSVEEQIAKMSDRLNTNNFPLALVALMGSVPVGTVSLKIQEMTTHKHLYHWLGTLYVLPNYRKKGIGRTLVKHAETKARELGVKTLYLHTPDKEQFYMHQGWETIERPVYFGMQVAVMSKEI
ncbi:MAG: GNAT family N-acetyltransferase [Deltaproteobacteria bacterium]|nr:GNAT family N-acetyltransferase [Deltaproteobacteria bacterium]